MTRLAFATLDRLPVDARVPAYDRKQPCGVVHLGTGAFIGLIRLPISMRCWHKATVAG